MASRNSILSSDGVQLHFLDGEMYKRYLEEERNLHIKYYKEIRKKHGIWASNQDRFVRSTNDLNDRDSRIMERLCTGHN